MEAWGVDVAEQVRPGDPIWTAGPLRKSQVFAAVAILNGHAWNRRDDSNV